MNKLIIDLNESPETLIVSDSILLAIVNDKPYHTHNIHLLHHEVDSLLKQHVC